MTSIRKAFEQRFGRTPDWIVAAPGRVNLIGEHTDHNGGFVLPMAIEKHTLIAAGRSGDETAPRINAYSVNLDEADEFTVSGSQLQPAGNWTDYIKGVLAEFLERGLAAASLDILVQSDVPIGCGLSSSAALQVATARLLQQLDASIVSDMEVAALCQTAEHKFAGVPVGIMDQYCIANARKNHLVYLDCRAIEAEHIPFDDTDTAVLIINSHVSRELRRGAYAKRRAECIEACRILGIDELRDATEKSVEHAKEALGDVLYRRARHVTSENARTVQAVSATMCKDWSEFGELMYASHESMARDFEISCKELDILVSLAQDIGVDGGVLGSRMTGGGFGGCTVSLIGRARADGIVATMTTAYRNATGIELSACVSSPAQGARVLEAHELALL